MFLRPHSALLTFVLLFVLFGGRRSFSQQELPGKLAEELLQVYGKKLDSVTYIPALAVNMRYQLGGELERPEWCEEAELILAKAPQTLPKSNVEFAGHLAFASIARDSQHRLAKECRERIIKAADQLFDGENQVRLPKSDEMSDALFMVGPILSEAGVLSQDPKYFDGASKYLLRMIELRQRADGLFQHGHLCDTAWGRGNGFAAVGLTWTLSNLPSDHPGRAKLLSSYEKLMQAAKPFQTTNGMWRQVIDHPESYEEFSCTCMLGFAMQRGIQNGWLPSEEYMPIVELAWQGVNKRVDSQGNVIDVCEGTGTQKSLQDYLDRKPIRGKDDRAGAMILLFTTERIVGLKSSKPN